MFQEKINTATALQRLRDNNIDVSLVTLINWCKKNVALGRKVGGRWYVNPKALEHFIEKGNLKNWNAQDKQQK